MNPHDTYVACRIDRANSIGPTSIMGPRVKLRGAVLRPNGRHKALTPSSLIYPRISLLFFHVGLMTLLVFVGNVATSGAVD